MCARPPRRWCRAPPRPRPPDAPPPHATTTIIRGRRAMRTTRRVRNPPSAAAVRTPVKEGAEGQRRLRALSSAHRLPSRGAA
nr:unnamed protein product [Callosobruchus analis]